MWSQHHNSQPWASAARHPATARTSSVLTKRTVSTVAGVRDLLHDCEPAQLHNGQHILNVNLAAMQDPHQCIAHASDSRGKSPHAPCCLSFTITHLLQMARTSRSMCFAVDPSEPQKQLSRAASTQGKGLRVRADAWARRQAPLRDITTAHTHVSLSEEKLKTLRMVR